MTDTVVRPATTPSPVIPGTTPGVSTTNSLTLLLQQALAKGDLQKSLETMTSLLNLSGDNRLKADLLLKLIDLTKHFTSLIAASPMHTLSILKSLRFLLIDKEPTLRSQSLRVLRYLATDWEMINLMLSINLDLFIVRSLERESKFLWERMQALKFIRQWMAMLNASQVAAKTSVTPKPSAPSASSSSSSSTVSRDPVTLTRSVVQSLVAIAEQPKDDFRRVCLDALRELTIISPAIVSSCNGIRTLVDSILDPACIDIASSLTLTLLHLIDSESTRGYLRPSVDLVRLISVFTDTTAADNPERENRRAAAHKALVMLMRSWTGILVLTSDRQCLRALIGMLNLPPSIKGSSWARETIFDLLFEIIHIVRANDVRSCSMRIRNSMTANILNDSGICHAYPPNLLYSYMVMLLLAFLHCDLIEILTQLALSADEEFALVASKLLGEIMGLSSELLPREICKKLNSMRGVIACAAAFGGINTLSQSSGGGGGFDGDEDLLLPPNMINESNSLIDGSVTRRIRAVNVLSSLAHSELNFQGSTSNSGYGCGNNTTVACPGTGWAWTGPLGVNWEAVAYAAHHPHGPGGNQHGHHASNHSHSSGGRPHASHQSYDSSARRESHDWALNGGGGGMTRNGSFSRGSTSDNTEYTPTGRRAVLHGIRLERLSIRADIYANQAKLINSGIYGQNVTTAGDIIQPLASLSSHLGLLTRNRLKHRLHHSAKISASMNTNAGSNSSEFHFEESELNVPLKKSQVLATKEFKSWDWEYIQFIIEKYMMTSPTHTAYLVLKTKFPKRLLSFLRADKKHFIELDWQLFHLRYVRMGVSLLKALLGCQEAREYQWFTEFIDGIFLAVLWEIAASDGHQPKAIGGTGYEKPIVPSAPSTITSVEAQPSAFIAGRRLSHLPSGLPKAKSRIFAGMSRSGCQSRLIREYFVFLGILSGSPYGIPYFEKFAFNESILHLSRDSSKDYITKLLIQNLSFFSGPTVIMRGWRRMLEGWLQIPPVGKEYQGCNVYMRMWTIDQLMIGWRRQQQGMNSVLISETELLGTGILSSTPSASVGSIVAHASLGTGTILPDPGDCGPWVMGLLLTQLLCLDLPVRSAVLDSMEEIGMNDPLALHSLISRRPHILRDLAAAYAPATFPNPPQPLYPTAQRLMSLFLSTRSGLDFLKQKGQQEESWLDIQLDEWRFSRGSNNPGACTGYVRGLEDALVNALSSHSKEEHEQSDDPITLQSANERGGTTPSSKGMNAESDELATPGALPLTSANAWNGPLMRSALDDHLFERIHALPWVVDLTLEYPQGRSVQVMTECWVVTTSFLPHGASGRATRPSSNSDDGPPPPPPSSGGGGGGGGGGGAPADSHNTNHPLIGQPMTYLVCQLLDLEGFPRPAKIEANVTVRTRIGIGAGVHSANVPDTPGTGGTSSSSVPLPPPTPHSRIGSTVPPRGGIGLAASRDQSTFAANNTKDPASLFQEEREHDRDWAKTFFPDTSGHASEYVCRPRDRDRISADTPYIVTPNVSDISGDDEARWHFEVPDTSVQPYTHAAVRGGVLGSSQPGVLTLESVWFPLPLPVATVPSVALLPHFYGELGRTEEGAGILAETGQVKEFERCIMEGGLSGMDVMKTGGDDDDDVDEDEKLDTVTLPSPSSALEKRAALWAIGHIGSTQYGFSLLTHQAPSLVNYLSHQAVACPTISMRGTCFYVLGLLGRSQLGRSALAQAGWSFSPFPGGCIAIPSHITFGGLLDHTAEAEHARRMREEQEEQLEMEMEDELRVAEMITSENTSAVVTRSRAVVNQQPPATPAIRTMAAVLSPAAAAAAAVLAVPAPSAAPISSSPANILRLDWPADAYRGSWANDPANIYGINSSKRTRKVGGVEGGAAGGAGGGGADEKSQSQPKDDANEVLSSVEGIEVILSHLSNLCNHVTQKNSLQALRTMKAQPHHAHFFTSPLLLFETFKLLACYSYKLPARRFLFWDLFGGVAFNLHTITQFDQPFQAENVSSFLKQKVREQQAQITATQK